MGRRTGPHSVHNATFPIALYNVGDPTSLVDPTYLESVSFSPHFLDLVSLRPYSILFAPNRQGIREGYNPGYYDSPLVLALRICPSLAPIDLVLGHSVDEASRGISRGDSR